MTEEENSKEKQISAEELPQEEESQEDFKDKYLRLLAEMENSRKRLQKEKHEMTRFAIENVLAEILLPMDMFENALHADQNMSQETRNWAKGFEMILTQFKEILGNHNITAFHSQGENFDPHRHEAIEIEETHEYPEGTILQEFLKGYKSGERILRAARVKVAKKPIKKEANKEEEKERNHDSQ